MVKSQDQETKLRWSFNFMLSSQKQVTRFFKEQDIAYKNIKTGPPSGQASVAAAVSPKPLPFSVPNLQAQFPLPASVDWDVGLPSAGEETFQHDSSQEGDGRWTP